jgi:hypothetical protein
MSRCRATEVLAGEEPGRNGCAAAMRYCHRDQALWASLGTWILFLIRTGVT